MAEELKLPSKLTFEGADVNPWDPTHPDAVEPAWIVTMIHNAIPDPLEVPPSVILGLLKSLRQTTTAFMQQKGIPRDLNELVASEAYSSLNEDARNIYLQLMRDFWRTLEVLDYMIVETEDAIHHSHLWEEPEEDGYTVFYKRVVGPLVDGMCWGPPACHVEAVKNYGKAPMPIMPVVARPFITMRAYGVYQSTLEGWWSNLMQSISEAIADAGKAVEATGEAIARAAAGARVATWETVKLIALIGGVIFGGAILVKFFAQKEAEVVES